VKRRGAHRAQRKAKEAALSDVAGTLFGKAGPTSRCTCGHTGDGPRSQHDDRYAKGHGACLVDGCLCMQFSWASHLSAGAS